MPGLVLHQTNPETRLEPAAADYPSVPKLDGQHFSSRAHLVSVAERQQNLHLASFDAAQLTLNHEFHTDRSRTEKVHFQGRRHESRDLPPLAHFTACRTAGESRRRCSAMTVQQRRDHPAVDMIRNSTAELRRDREPRNGPLTLPVALEVMT